MKITKKDLLLVLAIMVIISIFTIAGWFLMKWAIVFVIMLSALLIISFLMLELYRRHKIDSFKIDTDLKYLNGKFTEELKSFHREFNIINTELNSLIKETGILANTLTVLKNEQSQIKEEIRIIGFNQKKLNEELRIDLNTSFIQTESLFSLFSTIQPKLPLSKTRGWAASPDFLNMICTMILTRNPGYIFEAGGGISTIVIAYCLKRLGKGKIVSLDHLPEYADSTREMIAMHDLTEFAEIYYAPLKEVQINNETWLWYDLTCLKPEEKIDILIVDGPPAAIRPLARYPSLPLLYDHLSKDAVVVLDDGIRQEEKDIVERYKNEFPSFTARYMNLEKGAFILSRIG